MGLRENDLKNLVEKVFEVDSYKSKMGSDSNIVVIAFSVKQKSAADDLASFIEKGYKSVLDADATPGEQQDGTYKVFVELERDKDIAEQVREIVDGIERLSGRSDFRFRYHKNFRSQDATLDNLEQKIPADPDAYEIAITENRLDSYKDFFNRSFLDEITMLDDHLVLKKKWADPINFEFVDFGDAEQVLESQTGTFDVLTSYPEIMYLTKYIGDYAVSKYGENIVLENEDKALVLRRLT